MVCLSPNLSILLSFCRSSGPWKTRQERDRLPVISLKCAHLIHLIALYSENCREKQASKFSVNLSVSLLRLVQASDLSGLYVEQCSTLHANHIICLLVQQGAILYLLHFGPLTFSSDVDGRELKKHSSSFMFTHFLSLFLLRCINKLKWSSSALVHKVCCCWSKQFNMSLITR